MCQWCQEVCVIDVWMLLTHIHTHSNVLYCLKNGNLRFRKYPVILSFYCSSAHHCLSICCSQPLITSLMCSHYCDYKQTHHWLFNTYLSNTTKTSWRLKRKPPKLELQTITQNSSLLFLRSQFVLHIAFWFHYWYSYWFWSWPLVLGNWAFFLLLHSSTASRSFVLQIFWVSLLLWPYYSFN